jgi:hypoxanthine phosphoribosyltransferase
MKGSMPPGTEILISRDRIAERVLSLAAEIQRDPALSDPAVVPVMNGGMIFAADLVRAMERPLTLHPVRASSYGREQVSSGLVTLGEIAPEEFVGRNVLIVDDILDTGLTLSVLRERLLREGARVVRDCVLLRKASARHLHADHVGFEIPDRYVFGYGLDLDGRWRNLPDIAAMGVPAITSR